MNKTNVKLKEHAKPIQTPKTEPSAKAVKNQGSLIAFEKTFVLDAWLGSELTPEKLTYHNSNQELLERRGYH